MGSSSSNIPRPIRRFLRDLFTKMGFPAVAQHKRKDVTLHRQGEINFIINAEHGSYAEQYAKDHGPSACAMAFRVKNAKAAFERAVESRRHTGEQRFRARGDGHSLNRRHWRIALVLRRHLWKQGLDLRG